MNEKNENQLNEIINLIHSNKLSLAKKKVKIILKSQTSNDLIFNIMGIIYLREKDYSKAIINFKKAIQKNKFFVSALTNLSMAYKETNLINESIDCLKKVIKININDFNIWNEIGILYLKIKKNSEAIKSFHTSISINTDNFNAYYNLGLANLDIAEYKESIKNFKKSIEIYPAHQDVYFYLAEVYRKIQKFKDAKTYYYRTNNEKKDYKILQCLFEEGNAAEYSKKLDEIITNKPDDRRIAALTSFVSSQLNIKNKYPFCPDPLNFVYETSINKYKKKFQNFIDNLLLEISNENYIWEPSGKTTVKGYGTFNLSAEKLTTLNELKKIILNELVIYFNLFSNKKDNFILNKPDQFNFISWSNILKKEGYNVPHIHPSGWVSGVFYLKVPKTTVGDEAGIQFHLSGDDYKIINKNMPTKKIQPKVGSLVMFPSSLYHSTIPFSSNEERVCIAFDLCKQS